MRQFLRNNGLSLVVVATFLAIWLGGQSWSGMRTYNEERRDNGETEVSFGRYFRTAHFGEATFENWESEFLQMAMYVILTVKLRQRGSAESKPFDEDVPQDDDPRRHRHDADAPWPVRRGGAWLTLYRNSLSVTLLTLFFLSFVLHSTTGSRVFNSERAANGSTDHVTGWSYPLRGQFWFESLQNWQSEFLAVASIVILTIFLRQYGSPESKPVHAPTAATGNG